MISLRYRRNYGRLIQHPGLALVPMLMFVAAYTHQRISIGRGFKFPRFVVLGAGVAWLIYSVYEFAIARELKPESVPIRADFLIIYPALLVVTGLGFVAYVNTFRTRP